VGIQNDEALFGSAIYDPVGVEYQARIFRHMVPTMIMSYIGALKAWTYAVIFALWPPSPYSLRVPVLVAGAATIWLLFLLLRDIAGRRAALAGAALLAFDTTFLLTTTFDWGPVAFQHLLLMAGLYLLFRFYKSGRLVWLGAGFFCFGMGLWDKALFAWMLGGVGVASLVVFPREIRFRLTWRNTGLAAACFLIGCWPLVGYNRATGLKTFRSNARFSTAGVDDKLFVVRASMEGNSLFGYVVRDEPAPQPGRPASTLENWSLKLSDITDEPHLALTGIAFVLALALLPWLWTTPARRPMLFALVLMTVVWAQMTFTQDAGGGTHHAVLLWPFPHVLIAVAFAQAAGAIRRAAVPVLAVVIAIVCGSNFLLTNQHLARLIDRGAGASWTDAIYPLAEYMKTVPAKHVYIMDWGMFDGLRLLNRGRLPLSVGSDQAAKESMDDADRKSVNEMLAAADAVWIGHTEGNEILSGISARMLAFAEAAGYRKQVLKVIADRTGRPMFEVYRWVRTSARLTIPTSQAKRRS
jgi:4-amino-4-deoxy-L-arabinose transferase-like glycosyltransferase